MLPFGPLLCLFCDSRRPFTTAMALLPRHPLHSISPIRDPIRCHFPLPLFPLSEPVWLSRYGTKSAVPPHHHHDSLIILLSRGHLVISHTHTGHTVHAFETFLDHWAGTPRNSPVGGCCISRTRKLGVCGVCGRLYYRSIHHDRIMTTIILILTLWTLSLLCTDCVIIFF
ncbi:hypothetical protein H4582DRAFT_625306 [Lactarius indigo]|nr:hypothetical protein H4582DRAFT_481992 [Lactarius indigo]KAI9435813.1 hypothetical protein H4582DRAFT_625306 [Lactarius indigo]